MELNYFLPRNILTEVVFSLCVLINPVSTLQDHSTAVLEENTLLHIVFRTPLYYSCLKSRQKWSLTELIIKFMLQDLLATSLVIPLLPQYANEYGLSPSMFGLFSSVYGCVQLFSSPFMVGTISSYVLILGEASQFIFVLIFCGIG